MIDLCYLVFFNVHLLREKLAKAMHAPLVDITLDRLLLRWLCLDSLGREFALIGFSFVDLRSRLFQGWLKRVCTLVEEFSQESLLVVNIGESLTYLVVGAHVLSHNWVCNLFRRFGSLRSLAQHLGWISFIIFFLLLYIVSSRALQLSYFKIRVVHSSAELLKVFKTFQPHLVDLEWLTEIIPCTFPCALPCILLSTALRFWRSILLDSKRWLWSEHHTLHL